MLRLNLATQAGSTRVCNYKPNLSALAKATSRIRSYHGYFLRRLVIKFLLLLAIFVSSLTFAGEIFVELPKEINASDKYVFYSHGLIVEGDNPTPVNPRWGTYQFPTIKKQLADDSYHLIAYHRPKNTVPKQFAQKLADDVNTLIAKGVAPKNIALVGFSRGGDITILASKLLKSSDIKFVLMASCFNSMKNNDDYQVYGHIFSVFETSDGVGSCQNLIDQSPNITSFAEISISTGKEHGAFYRPMPQWLNPVKAWLKQ